jgi:hypothetical protein
MDTSSALNTSEDSLNAAMAGLALSQPSSGEVLSIPFADILKNCIKKEELMLKFFKWFALKVVKTVNKEGMQRTWSMIQKGVAEINANLSESDQCKFWKSFKHLFHHQEFRMYGKPKPNVSREDAMREGNVVIVTAAHLLRRALRKI